ncbi:4Fe-4S dicluster domain-containing protein [candidate division CSSED10-310 bacterium]|uniref:4Fe-4S dicluster domain-containing protein n=1 Tax=candidate division CSSED10-310 bacterium TaxID=2855610 RepID=A0ABV6Z5Q6_UNCC1
MSTPKADKIIEAVFKAGIVGAGGAGFPTHVKLQCRADVVIANGVECEPLLYHDKHVMEDRASKVIYGLKLAMRATKAQRGLIALKKKYKKAAQALDRALKKADKISLFWMNDYYPAGDEQEIVRAVTGKTVPPASIPIVVGAVVSNVTTLAQVSESLDDKPVVSRMISLVGNIPSPVTIEVPLGMSIADLLAQTGNEIDATQKILGGGVMMGTLENLTGTIKKTTTGLIILPAAHPRLKEFSVSINTMKKQALSACCQCQSCQDICPRFLLGHPISPHKSMRSFVETGNLPPSALLCCECGLCTSLVTCPMGISPRKVHQHFKSSFAAAAHAPSPSWQLQAEHPHRQFRRISSQRLKEKLDLVAYDHEPVRFTGKLQPTNLKIYLKQHIGISANPVVSPHQKVQKGMLLGKITADSVGANVHCPISGEVQTVDQETITIMKAS